MEKSVSFWFAFNNAILPQAPVWFYALFANWSPQLFSLSQYWRKAHEWPVCTALLMLHWFQSQFDYLHIQLLCYCILKRLHCLWAPPNPDVIEALFPYRLSKFSQVKWLLRLHCFSATPTVDSPCTSARATEQIRSSVCGPQPQLWP